MELRDLKQSITDLPTDELEAMLKDIRQSRRTVKRVYTDKPATRTKAAKSTATPSLEQLMASLSPEQLLAILQANKKEK